MQAYPQTCSVRSRKLGALPQCFAPCCSSVYRGFAPIAMHACFFLAGRAVRSQPPACAPANVCGSHPLVESDSHTFYLHASHPYTVLAPRPPFLMTLAGQLSLRGWPPACAPARCSARRATLSGTGCTSTSAPCAAVRALLAAHTALREVAGLDPRFRAPWCACSLLMTPNRFRVPCVQRRATRRPCWPQQAPSSITWCCTSSRGSRWAGSCFQAFHCGGNAAQTAKKCHGGTQRHCAAPPCCPLSLPHPTSLSFTPAPAADRAGVRSCQRDGHHRQHSGGGGGGARGAAGAGAGPGAAAPAHAAPRCAAPPAGG